MIKRFLVLVFVGFMATGLCGCFAMMALMADTAKAKQVLDISYSQAIDIVKGAMKAENIQFQEAVIKEDIAQAKGKYVDGKIARIYIHKINDTQCSISVRVGTSQAGKEDAEKILQAIIDYYDLTKGKS